MTEFEILWLDHEQRTFAITVVSKRDLTAAINAACNLVRKGSGNAGYAHGLYVRKKEDA